jgi:hypothetical protein
MSSEDPDYTDPDYALGAVLAQLEDLSAEDAHEVLLQALAARTTLDDQASVLYAYNEASSALHRLHAVASEAGSMTGPVRDALFGINSTLDAVMALAGVHGLGVQVVFVDAQLTDDDIVTEMHPDAGEDPGYFEQHDHPTERLTRLCDAMTSTLEAHDEYRDGVDRCIILIDDDETGGLVIHGYDPDEGGTDAVANLFMHLRAIIRSTGRDLDFVAIPESPEGIDFVERIGEDEG